MSTIRSYAMPRETVVGKVNDKGEVVLADGFQKFFGGIEDVTGRVSAYLDPTTATTAQIVNALIAAKLMKPE